MKPLIQLPGKNNEETMKTKKRAAGVAMNPRPGLPARRGGVGRIAAEISDAPTIQRRRVTKPVTDEDTAQPANTKRTVELKRDTDEAFDRPNTKRLGGERSDTAGACARRKNNGRSGVGMKAKGELNGHAGGEMHLDAEWPNAASKNIGNPRVTEITEKKLDCQSASDGTIETEKACAGGELSGNGEMRFATEVRCAVSRKSKAVRGESAVDTEDARAAHSTNKAAGESSSETDRNIACRSIQELQRHRCAAIKMQVAGENRIVAHVATLLGYRAGLDEKDRKKRFVESRAIIKQIVKGETLTPEQEAIAARVRPLVLAADSANALIIATREAYEKEMESLAKSLPVLPWVKSVRGFGVLNLAIVIGEAGDLSNYSNPAKLWKRLGLAPFKGAMGSTHRRKGGLSKDEWSAFGYSPRRRSQLHLLSSNMVMNNKGDYRKRYDDGRAKAKEAHPDWTDGHLHAHGMLLALKRVVLDLWKEWNA